MSTRFGPDSCGKYNYLSQGWNMRNIFLKCTMIQNIMDLLLCKRAKIHYLLPGTEPTMPLDWKVPLLRSKVVEFSVIPQGIWDASNHKKSGGACPVQDRWWWNLWPQTGCVLQLGGISMVPPGVFYMGCLSGWRTGVYHPSQETDKLRSQKHHNLLAYRMFSRPRCFQVRGGECNLATQWVFLCLFHHEVMPVNFAFEHKWVKVLYFFTDWGIHLWLRLQFKVSGWLVQGALPGRATIFSWHCTVCELNHNTYPRVLEKCIF